MLSVLGSFHNVVGWKTAAGPLVQTHRLLRRICCGGVRQHHLGVKKTASIVSTISRLHQMQFQFSHVHFPAGSEFCSCSFHLMSLDSKSLHFTSFAFRLALTFCDLALLLRPSLLYQRSVKRRHHWACPMCLCGTLRWSGGGGVVEGLLPSWKFHF